jgi:hypothetical protein
MAQWLLKHKKDEYDMVFVFANTGQENEETLEFVDKCDKHFGLNVHWVEAIAHHGQRKGTTHKVVNFETASRNGEPFEDIIKKYGIPNQAFPHCTRETKLNPITSFTKEYFGTRKYYTAIGIRIDEADRMNDKWKERRLVYPLIRKDMQPMTKPKINFFWKTMPFRLKLKGYQGNCKTCWKKSDKKLWTIANENPEYFDFMNDMEEKYPRVGAEFKKDETCIDRVFFRKNRTAKDIISEAYNFNGNVVDDAQIYDIEIDLFENESCEVWSNCGDDKPTCTKWQKWDWRNDGDPDDDKNPKAPIPVAPNQLMLFSVADEILQNSDVKQESSACV